MSKKYFLELRYQVGAICRYYLDLFNPISNIFWNAHPKKIKILDFQLRTTPQVNDIEEDYDLRQIGNVIYKPGPEQVSVYELGYSKEQPSWRICAIQDAKNNYLIGWCEVPHLGIDTN